MAYVAVEADEVSIHLSSFSLFFCIHSQIVLQRLDELESDIKS
jgi:hypothetical protein